MMHQETTTFGGMQTNGSNELATTSAAAKEQYEIQSAITIAKKFPRNEEACFQKLMKAASRPSFAEDATYSFPRGDQEVSGPSVNLAREAGRIWGNIRFGVYVVREDEESRLIRAWAWDLETNTKNEFDDDFKKLIQRKKKGGKPGETVWIVPDERDLRELTNRRGAILLRNAILQMLPKDLIQDALFACEKALQESAKENPEAARKRLLVDFGSINITVDQIEQKLGHPFAQSTPKELAELRGICKSILDGNSTWAEYSKKPETKPADDPNKATLAAAQEALKQHREQKSAPTTAIPTPSGGAAPAAVPRAHAESPATGVPPGAGPAGSGEYDAAWLSEVVDCEDYLRGSQTGNNALRAIRSGFKLKDDAYPVTKQKQQEYLAILRQSVQSALQRGDA